MCELFGASFNKQAGIQFAFTNFRERGRANPDGWGLAWYPDDKSSQIIKEAKPAAESPMSKFLTTQNTLKSKIFISHVRIATGTPHVHSNTHPFGRIYNRRDFVFAHNGSLSGFENLELSGYYPLGDTDSEYAFCFLLGFIREAQIKTWSPNRFEILKRKLQKINEHGKFNCIFSDGEYLFCYHTNSERAPTLRYVRREFPFNNIRYKDSEQEILLEDLKDESHKGYIISTKVLSEGEDWRDFEAGQLMVFKKGEIVFS